MDSHEQPSQRELSEARWTALALGQLQGDEKEAVEREVHDDAEAQAFIAEIRALAEHVQAARRDEPLPAASSELRQRIVEEIEDKEIAMSETSHPRPSEPTPPRRRRWSPVLTAVCSFLAGCIVVALILPALEPPRSSGPTPGALARANEAASPGIEKTASGPSEKGKTDELVEAVALKVAPGSTREVPIRQNPSTKPVADANLTAALTATKRPSGATAGGPTGTAANAYSRMVPPLTGDGESLGPYDSVTKKPVAAMPGQAEQTGRFMVGVGVNSDAGLQGSIVTDERFQSSVSKPNATGGTPAARYDAVVVPQSLGTPCVEYNRVATGPSASPATAQGPYSPYMRLNGNLPAAPQMQQPVTVRYGENLFTFSGRTTSTVDTSTEGELAEGRFATVGLTAPGVFSADLGTEQYAPIIENRFLAPYDMPLSTFSIDVDTASYANVRRFLVGGQFPPPNAVRIEEMVNYFSYDYPRPEGDNEPFSVNFELADCPWNTEHQLLRVGLAGRKIDRNERGLSNLVFLLDVSGSMANENKLPLVKKAMRLLVERLTEDDRVAIVTYASGTAVRLESTNAQDKKAILDVIDSLTAGGSTNGSGGIQLAYEQAAKNFLSEGNNRVILATDGDLNVGITQDDELVKFIEKKAKSGVFLSVLGFGMGNLKDAKLEKLADQGNGNYAYIDNLREARKVLVEEMNGSLFTIAKDVKIQIEFNPARVAGYRLIGYENRKLRARDFNDDTKDAGEIGAGHTVTALYELVPAVAAADQKDVAGSRTTLKYQKLVRPVSTLTEDANRDELATVRLRYKQPDGKESRLIERVVTDVSVSFSGATPDFQFAAAVASFGMILRGSQYAGNATLEAVEEYAAPGLSNDPNGYRAEFVDLVRKARQLKPVAAIDPDVPNGEK
ncbi:MAG: von Willebrand factor type A domain-containing protein [Pirellulales bacterium]|nr:von Willebrand factor type A domain-containing protein [Pirellulales bacterium]